MPSRDSIAKKVRLDARNTQLNRKAIIGLKIYVNEHLSCHCREHEECTLCFVRRYCDLVLAGLPRRLFVKKKEKA